LNADAQGFVKTLNYGIPIERKGYKYGWLRLEEQKMHELDVT